MPGALVAALAKRSRCRCIKGYTIMTIGLVGRKAGMTRVFTDAGDAAGDGHRGPAESRHAGEATRRPTAIAPCRSRSAPAARPGSTKPVAGHYAKPRVAAGPRSSSSSASPRAKARSSKTGAELKVDLFKEGQVVDVTRHDERQGLRGRHEAPRLRRRHDESHGNSVVAPCPGLHRPAPDAGPRVPGQAHGGPHGRRRGARRESRRSSRSTLERNLLLVSGAVPGAAGGHVVVRPSVKAAAQARRKTVGAGEEVIEASTRP